MKEDGIDKLFEHFKLGYYSDFFVLLTQIIGIIASILYFKKAKMHYLLFLYILAGLFLLLCQYYGMASNFSKVKNVILLESANQIFTLIEYTVWALFFREILTGSKIKLITNIIGLILIIAVIYFFVVQIRFSESKYVITQYSSVVNSISLLSISILSMSYYVQLFKKKPDFDLMSSPSFWIVAGLFFYSTLIAPFFTIAEYIRINKVSFYDPLFIAHYITFGILFLAIAKALSCKKILTT